MMAQYSSTPYVFNSMGGGPARGFPDFDDDDDSSTEEGLDALDAPSEPHTPDWKEYIRNMGNTPAPLKLGEKPGTEKYKFEKQDPKHRMGDLLELCFKTYQAKERGDPDGIHFYEWLDRKNQEKQLNVLLKQWPDIGKHPDLIEAFMQGVAYMDKQTRQSHKVAFRGGTAFTRRAGSAEFSQELDTGEMQTVFSGKGFAIWVMKESGRVFAGNHVKGLVHHSSFLAGGDVMCGGEMKAHMGKIELLSAKSGHYQPSMSHLVWALRVLETCVDNYEAIKIMAWAYPTTTPLRLISPSQLRRDPNVWQWGHLTANELARLRNRDYASFV